MKNVIIAIFVFTLAACSVSVESDEAKNIYIDLAPQSVHYTILLDWQDDCRKSTDSFFDLPVAPNNPCYQRWWIENEIKQLESNIRNEQNYIQSKLPPLTQQEIASFKRLRPTLPEDIGDSNCDIVLGNLRFLEKKVEATPLPPGYSEYKQHQDNLSSSVIANGSHLSIGSSLSFILLGPLLLLIYFLPTIIAIYRRIPKLAACIILNLFGCTCIGWIVAMVLASLSYPKQQT